MAVKLSVIAAVSVLFTVDNAIGRMAFPTEYEHKTQTVEFDYVEGGTSIALKGNFAKESNSVAKTGFKTITVNPMQVNEKITDSGINFNKKRIGETVYGTDVGSGLSEAEKLVIENETQGFGVLKNRKDVLLKKSQYDVLTTGKIVVSADGDKVDEIDYVLPNIIVNDNATAGSYQWNDKTNAFPVEQLEALSLGMGMFGFNTVILGDEARKAWGANPNVHTVDNTTTGKRKNFNAATAEEKAVKETMFMLYLGQTTGDNGRSISVYAETEMYNDGANYYLNKNYVVGFTAGSLVNAQVQYGAIPVAQGEGEGVEIVPFVGKEWIDGQIEKDPAGVQRFYRSSPLPTMNKPKAFISIKATLIA